MYKVVLSFTDLQDDNHVYLVGDSFPRKGVEISDKRIAELSSNKNKRGIALIEKVEKPDKAVEEADISAETEEKAEEKPRAKKGKKSAEKAKKEK